MLHLPATKLGLGRIGRDGHRPVWFETRLNWLLKHGLSPLTLRRALPRGVRRTFGMGKGFHTVNGLTHGGDTQRSILGGS